MFGFRSLIAGLAVLSVLGCGRFLPDPQPLPVPPKPIPVAGDVWLIVIEESAETSAAFAELKNDLSFWSDLSSRGVRHFIYDDDLPQTLEGARPSDAARIRRYVEAVNGIDRPALVVITTDGTTVLKRRCPESRSEFEQLVKALGK